MFEQLTGSIDSLFGTLIPFVTCPFHRSSLLAPVMSCVMIAHHKLPRGRICVNLPLSLPSQLPGMVSSRKIIPANS